MGGGGSKGSSTTTSEASIAPELRPLYSNTGQRVSELQGQIPLSQFTGASPMQVAPLSETQNLAIGNIKESLRSARDTPLEQSDLIAANQRYYDTQIAPGIQNRAALSGLGRSTALTNAEAQTQAAIMAPLMAEEQGRRDRLATLGLAGGEVERGAEQDVYTAAEQDELRRQALAEQALFGPLNQMPSTIGQTATTKSKGGGGSGLFK